MNDLFRNKKSGRIVKLNTVSPDNKYVYIHHNAGDGHGKVVSRTYFEKNYEEYIEPEKDNSNESK